MDPERKEDLGYDFWQDEIKRLTKLLFRPMLASAMKSAKATLARLLDLVGVGIDMSLVSNAALDYVRTHSLIVAKSIIESTQKVVEKEMQNWIQSGEPISNLIDNLVSSGLFDPNRARMIAVTEITNAYAQGNVIVWKESGVVTKKVWQTANDERVCDECGRLHGSEVDLDGEFQAKNEINGKAYGTHETPPAHVNCRCWLQPVVEK